jgi:formamidopyrimidine-DNA glycosylase
MPELPEVETIRLQLLSKICGKKITKVEVKFAGLLNVPAKNFIRILTGAIIEEIRRRAKLLIFDLSNGWSLILHLKLTGQLISNGEKGIGQPHIIYTFEDGTQLKHYDFRRFGYVKLVRREEVETYLDKEGFGPEPLDKKFTLEVFRELLKKKPKALIKPLLMDQTFIAGVGNIYAQEACFFAQILPTRRVGSLNDEEIKRLYEGLKKILKEAINYRGSSVDSYVDALGKPGNYVSKLKVYGRGRKKCLRCGSLLKEAKLAGRSTVWCPKCQK